MARSENPVVERGKTMDFPVDETPGSALDPTGGNHLEGKEYMFEDVDIGAAVNGVAPTRSGKYVFCRLVRNKAATPLLPKRFAKYKTDGVTADVFGGQVDGHGDTVGQIGGVVDEFLPPAGAPVNSLFWIVVQGPTMMTTGAAGDTNIATGANVIPTTDGKVVEQDTASAAGIATFNQIQGAIGRVALGVNGINTDVMVLVRRML